MNGLAEKNLDTRSSCVVFDAFQANFIIIDTFKSLKHLESKIVFKRYKMGTLARNGLIMNKAVADIVMFCNKRCSKTFRNIQKKTLVLESLFNKVAAF